MTVEIRMRKQNRLILTINNPIDICFDKYYDTKLVPVYEVSVKYADYECCDGQIITEGWDLDRYTITVRCNNEAK